MSYEEVDHNYKKIENIYHSKLHSLFKAKVTTQIILSEIEIEIGDKDEGWYRFSKDMNAIQKLSHPNILPILFSEKNSNLLKLSMPFFNGESFNNFKNNLSINEIIKLFLSILEPFEFLHNHHLIHGQIYPGNILYHKKNYEIKVINYSLYHLIPPDFFLKLSKPKYYYNYLSPEQLGLLKRPVDQRSDLYSLGCLLYKLLTGDEVFNNLDDKLSKLILTHIPEFTKKSIPNILKEIVCKLVQKEPGERYQSIHTLKKDLEDAWENAEKIIEKTWKECPKCWKDLIYRHSKNGKFIWCMWYPECDFIEQPEEEKNAMQELKNKYEWKPCPDWIAWTIVVKTWRYWPFLASSEYPKVKWIGKIKNEKEEMLEEILTEKWLLVDEETWEELVVKNSRRWQFLAAKNYPKVKIAKNIPKDIWDELNKRLEKKEEE